MHISVSRYSFILILLSFSMDGYAENAADRDFLCPKLSERTSRSVQYGNLNKRITAPASKNEIREQFRQLKNPVREQRHAAIMALALAGNLELFERLVSKQDRDGLSIYTINYLNSDGTRCLDPVIEKTLIKHHQEPWLQDYLQGFFNRNLYRSRDLFKTFLSVSYQPDKPRAYWRYARALTSTNLTGIESQILQKAGDMLEHSTPRQKSSLPGIHQEFIKYFARRQYMPAVDYMREILQVEPRTEPKEQFRSNYLGTRINVYRALEKMPSAQSSQIFLEELAKLSSQPWDAYFSSELHQLLKFAIKADQSDAYQSKLLKQLVQILQTSSLPGQNDYVDRRLNKSGSPAYFDYQIRKNIYESLAEIGSRAAANALMDELQKVLQSSISQNQDVLVITLIGVFQEFSPTKNVDIVRLHAIVRKLPVETRASYQLSLMKRYFHPDNVELFFTELDEIFIPEGEPVSISDENTRYTNVNLLLQQKNASIDAQLRDRLDQYYQSGSLNKEKYLYYVRILNDRLGDESPVYKSIMAEKAREQQQHQREKAEQVREAQKQQMQALYDQHASPEGIRKDIQALSNFDREARQAGFWLVRVGPGILPYAHEALKDSSSNTKLKMQLITVLGEIGDTSSTVPIITTAQSYKDNAYVYQNAFFALSNIPQTQQAREFADDILSNKHSELSQRSALVWYARHRDQSANHWARKFSEPDISEKLRYAALYLAARLQLDFAQARIKHELLFDPDLTRRRNLLRALAEIASVEDYESIAKETKIVQLLRKDYALHLLACRYRLADKKQKLALATQLLAKHDPVYSRDVIRYLIRQQQVGILGKYLGINNQYGLPPEMVLQISPAAQLVFSEARRLGYQLQITGGELTIKK